MKYYNDMKLTRYGRKQAGYFESKRFLYMISYHTCIASYDRETDTLTVYKHHRFSTTTSRHFGLFLSSLGASGEAVKEAVKTGFAVERGRHYVYAPDAPIGRLNHFAAHMALHNVAVNIPW